MVTAVGVSQIPAVTEMTSDDLELERYLLDLALQPLDRFDGFVQIEQYLLSALRYQLNYTSYCVGDGAVHPDPGLHWIPRRGAGEPHRENAR